MAFELLLKQAMGLEMASISPAVVAHAVKGRMAACGISEMPLYENLLRTSESEMQELIEAVVVPETSFFRDREAFMTLGRLVVGEWSFVRPGDALRLLSLPCSTGEEPYSMAMMLFDAGLPPQRFRIDAIDISHRALKQAKGGVYGKNSFRGDDLDFRERYFKAQPPVWHLQEKVRRQVHFQQGNLVDDNLLLGMPAYDAIFCRNVLIYFDLEAQARVIETLDRLLLPDGVLFMGPSETSLLSPDRFATARLSHAFAFRKAKAKALRIKEKVVVKPVARRRMTQKLPPVVDRTKSRTVSFSMPSPIPSPPASPTNTLDEVMRLADEGHLSEALTLCQTHIRQQGPSARAYGLLGLIHDASHQQKEAVEFYRKALYLDPQNEEVLAHFSSLLKSQGDVQGARLMLDRARRLTQRQKA